MDGTGRLSRAVDRLGGPVVAPAAVLGAILVGWAALDFWGLAPWGVRNPHGRAVEGVPLHRLDAVLAEPGPPVVVDFWATWCAPCRAFTPVFREVASRYQGKARFVRVEVVDEELALTRYGVRGIPSVFVYACGGKVAAMQVANAEGLADAVERGLSASPEHCERLLHASSAPRMR